MVGVACGEWHALACTAAGRVLAWGGGPYGQLGGGRHNRSWVRAALLGSARGVQVRSGGGCVFDKEGCARMAWAKGMRVLASLPACVSVLC